MTTDGRLRAEKERLRALCYIIISRPVAGVAQLVEHVIRNDGVGSSNLFAGTTVSRSSRSPRPDLWLSPPIRPANSEITNTPPVRHECPHGNVSATFPFRRQTAGQGALYRPAPARSAICRPRNGYPAWLQYRFGLAVTARPG